MLVENDWSWHSPVYARASAAWAAAAAVAWFGSQLGPAEMRALDWWVAVPIAVYFPFLSLYARYALHQDARWTPQVLFAVWTCFGWTVALLPPTLGPAWLALAASAATWALAAACAKSTDMSSTQGRLLFLGVAAALHALAPAHWILRVVFGAYAVIAHEAFRDERVKFRERDPWSGALRICAFTMGRLMGPTRHGQGIYDPWPRRGSFFDR